MLPARRSPLPHGPTAPPPAFPARLVAVALLGLAAVAHRPVGAQERATPAPAEPPDTADLVIPVHFEDTLATGLRILGVPDSAAAATTWTLLIPGGSSADPEGREGTAALLGDLLQEAGGERDGTVLGVGASADAMALTLVDSTGSHHAAARRLGRILTAAPVSDSLLERVRAPRLEAVEATAEHPDVVAHRLLVRAVYGDHAYGRTTTPATLAAVGATDLLAWRRVHLRPDAAVLAVSGPIDRRGLLAAARGGLGEWRAPADAVDPPAPDPRGLPPGVGRRRILVHRPGAPETVIHLGVALPGPGDPDWTRLAVLDGVLASRPEEPLLTVRPPGAAEGIVAGTATSVQRRAGPGLFQARASVTVGVAADVVRGLLEGVAEAGRAFPSPSDLAPVRERLARSFRAQAEAPVGAAALLAANRVMGLPDSLMASYPRRVRRVGPQEVRDAAAEHLDTSRLSVVVVGDATLLRRELEAAGVFELVDARGVPLAAEDLEVPEESPALDASLLEPMTLRYRVVVQGQELGTVTRVLEAGPDALPGTMVFRSETGLGGREVGQSVTFTREGFRPVAARSSILGPGGSAILEVSVEGGRIVGRTRGGATGERVVDMPLPDGALVGDMLELASWLVPLDEGASYRFPVAAPEAGRTSPVILRVGAVEEVTVPAGTFRARLVETSGAEAQRYWMRVDAPRIPVRIEPAGRPVALELVSAG